VGSLALLHVCHSTAAHVVDCCPLPNVQEDLNEVFSRLLNELTLRTMPTFIYTAYPPLGGQHRNAAARRMARLGAGRGVGADDDEDIPQLWGCYAGVLMADCRCVMLDDFAARVSSSCGQ